MIKLTEQEFYTILRDFVRLDDEEQRAIVESLEGYFDSGRETWSMSCTAASVIMMDLITYMLEVRQDGGKEN